MIVDIDKTISKRVIIPNETDTKNIHTVVE
jgi:hypothetical protein